MNTLESIQDFKGTYPKQLWSLFFTEMWERFCFYGNRGMLMIFMTDILLFKEGDAKKWLLQDDQGKWIGRIAAFYYTKYKNKGTEFPTGCVGFFDCINDSEAAKVLFDTAKQWLKENGMVALRIKGTVLVKEEKSILEKKSAGPLSK